MNVISLSKKLEPAFVHDGFNNWKKALQRFDAHEGSDGHKEAVERLRSKRSTETVVHGVYNQHLVVLQQRRQYLLIVISTLRVLARQGIAIRGHSDSESNFMQFLELQAHNVKGFKGWLERSEYLSHDIQNEILSLMSQNILRSKLEKIRTAVWFSVIADECRDITNKEQLSICIRWVSKDFQVNEDFIGMMQVDKTDSATITRAIQDVLLRCILPLESCRG